MHALAIWMGCTIVVVNAGIWPAFKKIPKSDVPYSTMGRRATPEAAAAACLADASCKAYNSDGELKRCVGCEGGSSCCVYPAGAQDFPAADRIDLFVKNGAAPPKDWEAGAAAGSLLYSQPEPDICMMPEVGNGFLASIIGFSSLHVSGFFNGGCGGVSKAHLPSVIGITATNANTTRTQAALDMDKAVYVRRLYIESSSAVVEQRTFAHRIHKHIMVTEFELLSGADEVTLKLNSLFDPLCGPPPAPPPTPVPPPALAFNGTYLHVYGDSGVNNEDVGNLPQCTSGQCKVEEIKEACDENPKCDLFQTHGFLKKCLVPGTHSNRTTACNKRTPWVGVDAYYKIPTASENKRAAAFAFPGDVSKALALTDGSKHRGFGEGQPCGTAGNGCAGRFKKDGTSSSLPQCTNLSTPLHSTDSVRHKFPFAPYSPKLPTQPTPPPIRALPNPLQHDCAVDFEMMMAPAPLALANVTVFRGNVSGLQAHKLIQMYTNTDYCLVAFCTWIQTTRPHA
jgi:hypothetical protein